MDHGEWQSPSGSLHPFIAMEWIDGVPLYDWARLHPLSSQQVLQLLAQLARALQSFPANPIILLAGGDKSTQSKDIKRAIKLAKEA